MLYSHMDGNIVFFLLSTLLSLSDIELGFFLFVTSIMTEYMNYFSTYSLLPCQNCSFFGLKSIIPLVGPVFSAPWSIIVLCTCFSATLVRDKVFPYGFCHCHPQILLGVFVLAFSCLIKTILISVILFFLLSALSKLHCVLPASFSK